MKTPAGQDANATNVPPAEATGDDPFGFSPWLKQMPDVSLHPLMAHPVAAMAATTAIGLGIAGQMAGMMLGAMQSAAEQARAGLDDAAAPAARPETAAKVARERSAAPKAANAGPARRAPAARAAKADDLKAISGIGPKLEQVLNGMGFRRYADIAALQPADVARIEAEFGLDGRIARDGWVEQAKALAKGRGKTSPDRQ